MNRFTFIEGLVVLMIIGIVAITFYSISLAQRDPDKYCELMGYGAIQNLPAMCLERYKLPQQRIQIN